MITMGRKQRTHHASRRTLRKLAHFGYARFVLVQQPAYGRRHFHLQRLKRNPESNGRQLHNRQLQRHLNRRYLHRNGVGTGLQYGRRTMRFKIRSGLHYFRSAADLQGFGTTELPFAIPDTDLAGKPRLANDRIDIGAFQSPPSSSFLLFH